MNQKMNKYLESLVGKRIAVIGLGVSNTPLVKLLLRAGCEVLACDRKERSELREIADEFESLGATLRFGQSYLDDLTKCDVIFRTPGMRPDSPDLAAAAAKGAVITSEMEAFFEVCPCRTIAVTGSDGKTTTTTIISELLRETGYEVYLGGNIGKPLLSKAKGMLESDIAVLELSSFQLMTMKRGPDIAVITNISPNHLDYHLSMDEYIASKKNISIHQSSSGRLVVNADNAITRSFADEAKGSVAMFSRLERPDNGFYLNGRDIWAARGGEFTKVMPVKDIILPGVHNIENYMAAFAAVDGLVDHETCRKVASSFKGVEHRIELVRKLGGVSYYNDSIASSPTRTIAGLNSFDQKVILIAGGYDKMLPFTDLGIAITERVKTLVLSGDTASKIRYSVETAPGYLPDKLEIIEIDDFEHAVLAASKAAKAGDVVILSPACASFDKFKNFAERGDAFKKIVNNL